MAQYNQDLGKLTRFNNFGAFGNTAVILGTTASQSLALPNDTTGKPYNDVLITNSGTTLAFVAFGTSSVTVTAPVVGTPGNGIPVLPGITMVLDAGQNTFVGVILASGTGNIYFTQGAGS